MNFNNMSELEKEKALIPYILQILQDFGGQAGRSSFKEKLVALNDDIATLPGYNDLKSISGLFETVQLDESRTCVFWNDYIDLPSDIIYEYGTSN